jgi:ubiquinone biosynthesis protein UbiJ
MADESETLVLRLLREIRSEQVEQHTLMVGIDGRMGALERHMDDVKESVAYALGLSAHANVAYESTGQRLDRLTKQVSQLEARLERLERQE